jgi:tetratricopeptide (TPR) repeat protein
MAVDEFRKELAQNPNSADAMGMLALSLNFNHQPAEALAQAHAAIAANPENAFVYYALACVTVGRSKPPHKRYRFLSGLFNANLISYRRRLRRAKRPAMEAVRLAPRNPEFLALVGAIEFDLRRPKQALAWAEKALAVRGNHVRATNLRARALARLGRAKEARETFAGAIALDPDGATTHAHGGWTYLKIGDSKKAIAHFQEALRLNPNDLGAQNGLRAARRIRPTMRKVAQAALVCNMAYWAFAGISNVSPDNPGKNFISIYVGLIVAIVLGWAAVQYYRRRRSNKSNEID